MNISPETIAIVLTTLAFIRIGLELPGLLEQLAAARKREVEGPTGPELEKTINSS